MKLQQNKNESKSTKKKHEDLYVKRSTRHVKLVINYINPMKFVECLLPSVCDFFFKKIFVTDAELSLLLLFF